jgi:alanine racemase
MVRTGINLYGYFDMQGARDIGVQPVIELRAKLISVRTLTAGMSVGYGRTYPVDKPTRIGTVAIGYADGLPMQLCQGGHLIVRGVHCPIVGRVSMDYTTLLLDHVPEAQAGDDVLCLGPGLSLEEWVLRKGTAPYEVICALGQRVDRAYIT